MPLWVLSSVYLSSFIISRTMHFILSLEYMLYRKVDVHACASALFLIILLYLKKTNFQFKRIQWIQKWKECKREKVLISMKMHSMRPNIYCYSVHGDSTISKKNAKCAISFLLLNVFPLSFLHICSASICCSIYLWMALHKSMKMMKT